MKSIAHALYIPIILAAALFLACGGEEEVTKPTPAVNTTPANCLRVVAASWSDQNYSRYQPCISPNFVFYFNPQDVGSVIGEYTIPVSWNAIEMNDAIKNMLNEAYSINLAIPAGNIRKPGSGATTFRTGQVQIELVLLTAPGQGYRIGAGYCIFEFEKYREGGEDRWRLTKWRDHTRESRDSEAASLGRVLALYYSGE